MKTSLNPTLMAATIAIAFTANHSAQAADCQMNQLYFRTTQWLNPLDFTVSQTDELGNVVTSSPALPSTTSTSLPAPVELPDAGGLLWKTLEVPPGFKIKKALVCTNYPNTSVPVPDISVNLKQTYPTAVVSPLGYERMSVKRPGCAVYSVTQAVDELNNPGQPVDPRKSPTTLIISTPRHPIGDITAIGLRLQTIPGSPLWTFVPDHQHAYLTGRGVGHNNTVALTSGPTDVCDIPASVEFSDLDDTADFMPAVPGTTTITPSKPGKKK